MLMSVLLIAIGTLTVIRNTMHFRQPERLREYIATSPKAFLLRKTVGPERAQELTRRVFLPLGTLVGIGFIVAGAMTFWRSQ